SVTAVRSISATVGRIDVRISTSAKGACAGAPLLRLGLLAKTALVSSASHRSSISPEEDRSARGSASGRAYPTGSRYPRRSWRDVPGRDARTELAFAPAESSREAWRSE